MTLLTRSPAAERSRTAVTAAARSLFDRRGFHGVTIRAIAVEAGVSPSLIIKMFGSKSALYAECGASDVPMDGLDVPLSAIGGALVRRIVQRRRDGNDEPWAAPGTIIRQAEDSEAERERLRTRWLDWLADTIGDPTPEHRHAMIVGCLLAGLAEGVSTMRFADDDEQLTRLADDYARIVQAEVDHIRRR